MTSRRTFLTQAARATAGLAGMAVLPGWLDPRLSPAALFEAAGASLDEADVRAIALRAVEAAKAAGAQFADVRVNQTRGLAIVLGMAQWSLEDELMVLVAPMLGTTATLGVRALIDGTWGFAGGSRLTLEEAARVGRLASAYARDGRRRVPQALELAPAPSVPAGRWQTPIETDPFTIPIGHYLQLYRDGMTAAKKQVPEATPSALPTWERSDRAYASTEGSFIVQRIHYSNPRVGAWARRRNDRRLTANASIDAPAGGYGYETLAALDLKTAWPQAAEEAKRKAALPYKSVEVGQYPVVLGAEATASLLVPTGQALELDRALGEKANEEGTTFAMPPEDVLGAFQLGAPEITITGDRSRPGAPGTVGWDEEGVKPDEFALVEKGMVVDFVTTRATAPVLRSWYARRDRPVRSHGCAARTGRLQPILQLPNLTLQPGRRAASLEDLIKDVKRGFYVEAGSPIADQQLSNVQMPATSAYEIVNGKLGAAAVDMALQFSLPRFWRGVDALGGPDSVWLGAIGVDMDDPDRLPRVGASSVPALAKAVNVVTLGREA